MITIAIGTDHRGFKLKQYLIKQLISVADDTIEWIDVGAFTPDRSDYPLFAQAVCQAVLNNEASLGILLCGSGVGMSIAANRHQGIYAALAWNETVAQLSRAHDCANILILPADFITESQATAMLQVWLSTMPLIDEHADRLSLIDRLSKVH